MVQEVRNQRHQLLEGLISSFRSQDSQICSTAMLSHSPPGSYVSLRDPGLFAVANVEVAWFSSE